MTSSGKMLLGLQGISYFNGVRPFLNWWYQASSPTVFQSAGVGGGFATGVACFTSANGSGAPYFDATTGDVVLPFNTGMASFSRLIMQSFALLPAEVAAAYAAGGGSYANDAMYATCDPGWTILVANAGTGATITNNNTAKVSFTIGNSADAAPTVRPIPVGTPTNVPNIRVYKQKFEININNGEIFDPDWLAIIKPFKCLRFMDWGPTNNSGLTAYSQLAAQSCQYWGQAVQTDGSGNVLAPGTTGSVYGAPLAVIAALLIQTGCDGHYCIPAKATDSCVQSIASFFEVALRGTGLVMEYEFTNEHWNFGANTGINGQFTYCAAIADAVPGTPWVGLSTGNKAWRGCGYRAVAVMKLIHDIYNDRTRWKGLWGTQSGNTTVTSGNLIGINYYLTNVLGSGQVSDYFTDLLVTSYMGDIQLPGQIGSITAASPGIVTLNGFSFTNGTVIKLFMTNGAVQLNNTYAKVASASGSTFALNDLGGNPIDTTGMGKILTSCRLATAAVLPNTPIYSNGTAGVGATLTGTSNAALVVNSVTAAASDRILVKNQASAFQNGIYTVTTAGDGSTPWVLTRVTDFDQAAEMILGCSVLITAGSLISGAIWGLTASINTVGTDSVTFASNNIDNFAIAGLIFQIMDQSLANFNSNPATYPTKYTYFNQQIATSILTGTCTAGFATGVGLSLISQSDPTTGSWKLQKDICISNGIGLKQYEAGPNFYGNPSFFLTNASTASPQYNDYFLNFTFSFEMSMVMMAAYKAFEPYGSRSAKFTEGGSLGITNPWAGMRAVPTDTANPGWQIVSLYNAGKRRLVLKT